MKSYKVKELMVPLSDYATISKGATLKEAVVALEEAQERFDKTRYRHRSVLVLDSGNQVIGKVGQIDILRSLEPKYGQMAPDSKVSHFGFRFSSDFLISLREQYSLLDAPMDNICTRAAGAKVEDFMHILSENEYIEAEASLDAAIHQLVIGHYQSLLVKEEGHIIGMLRLSDIASVVSKAIKEVN